MSHKSDEPVDVYIASYSLWQNAQLDWQHVQQMAVDGLIKVHGLVLVRRQDDGKVHVEDNMHKSAKGALWGAVGGAVVGLLFPPAFLAGALIGAGAGAGVGGLMSHKLKKQIRADVEDTLPFGWSGIVVVFDHDQIAVIEDSLPQADKILREAIDSTNADEIKAAVAAGLPTVTG